MYKKQFMKRDIFKFKRFSNKGYALFRVLGREVVIGVLSVATLSAAPARTISEQTWRADNGGEDGIREVELDGVTVAGSRAPLALGQAARMVSVLSSEDIQAAPVQSVNDLLKYAVGVDVRQRGAMGAQTDIGIRGGTSDQMAILLNGVNITDPQTGHNSLDIPVELSEIIRIEIIEGPASRIFGTSALTGAINIVTHEKPNNLKAQNINIDARIEGGSFGFLAAGAAVKAKKAGFNNSVSGSWQHSDGFQRSKGGALNSDYTTSKAFYQGSFTNRSIDISWHAGISNKNWGSNVFYGLGSDTQFEHTRKWFTAVQGENCRGWFKIHPQLYWQRNDDRFEYIRNEESRVPFNHHRTDIFGAQLNSYFNSQLGRTAFGAELRNENVKSTTLGERLDEPYTISGASRSLTKGLSRSTFSFHLEHNILLRNFTLSAGFILSKNTWNKRHYGFYPGIDASYRVSNNWKMFASWNKALRLPSFTELYYNTGGHVPNPNLAPEELSALEVGTKYATPALSASLSLYHHRYRNMIDWIADSLNDRRIWKSVNHTKVRVVGIEANTTLNFGQIWKSQNVIKNFSIGYSYIHQDKHEQPWIVTESKMEYLRHKIVAQLNLHILGFGHNKNAMSVDMNLKYRFQKRNGFYTDNDGNTHNYSPYGLVDARITLSHHVLSASLEAMNLFNHRSYVDYGNVSQPGTWIIGGINIRI